MYRFRILIFLPGDGVIEIALLCTVSRLEGMGDRMGTYCTPTLMYVAVLYSHLNVCGRVYFPCSFSRIYYRGKIKALDFGEFVIDTV